VQDLNTKTYSFFPEELHTFNNIKMTVYVCLSDSSCLIYVIVDLLRGCNTVYGCYCIMNVDLTLNFCVYL